MFTEPFIFSKYGLGAHNTYENPIGMFLLELLPEPTTITPPNVLLLTLSPKLYCNQMRVTIAEVKELRQTIAIEMGYGEQVPSGNGSTIPSIPQTKCIVCVCAA
jgi:hypothetical protein